MVPTPPAPTRAWPAASRATRATPSPRSREQARAVEAPVPMSVRRSSTHAAGPAALQQYACAVGLLDSCRCSVRACHTALMLNVSTPHHVEHHAACRVPRAACRVCGWAKLRAGPASPDPSALALTRPLCVGVGTKRHHCAREGRARRRPRSTPWCAGRRAARRSAGRKREWALTPSPQPPLSSRPALRVVTAAGGGACGRCVAQRLVARQLLSAQSSAYPGGARRLS